MILKSNRHYGEKGKRREGKELRVLVLKSLVRESHFEG